MFFLPDKFSENPFIFAFMFSSKYPSRETTSLPGVDFPFINGGLIREGGVTTWPVRKYLQSCNCICIIGMLF